MGSEIFERPTSRRTLFKGAAAVGVLAAVPTLSACGGGGENPNKQSSGPASAEAGAKSANPNGTITAGLSYELGTNGFDPMSTTAALTLAANWHTMEGLTELDFADNSKPYAALGADLPKKIDDTHYEVTLRDGAKFHNGDPVTVEDVIFSFERVMDPANKSLYLQFISFLDKVTKKDDKTIAFALKFPFSLVAERLAVVKIVPKKLVEADAKGFAANPVGTGPWKMTDNSAASKEVVFEKFADYTGKRPAKAQKMVWKVVPDASTRTNAITSGSVQVIDSVPYLSIDTLKSTAKVDSVQGFNLAFVMFNCGSAPMDNVKNRQGVLYSFDMDKVVSTAFLGNASKVTCFVPENHPAYKKAKVVYSKDVDKAKALFKETGLTKVRMLVTNHDWLKPVTPILKESLEAAGLQVEFTELTSANLYNTIDGKPEAYDIVVAPGDPSVFGGDADLLMRWWYAGDTWTESRMHWKGQESYQKVQELLDKARAATGDEQKKLWGETFDVISENVPLYPLFHRKVPTAYDEKTLVDFKPISQTGFTFSNVGTTK